MSKEIKTIFSKKAPAPIGPYSQAIIVGDLFYASGQVALVPGSGEMKQGIDEEIQQVFSNLEGVLTEANLSFADVISVKVYLTDLNDFAKVNEAMEKHFTEPYPVRATIQVAGLPKGAKIEIELIAKLN